MFNSEEQVINKINDQINYIESVEELQGFWGSNSDNIKKITAYYLSYYHNQPYTSSTDYYDNLVVKITQNNAKQTKEKLKKLRKYLQNSEYSNHYIEFIDKQLILHSQFQSERVALSALNVFNQGIIVQDILDNTHTSDVTQDIYGQFIQTVECITPSLQAISQSLLNIEHFDLLKNSNENLVLIGSNGSGKSTFSRQIKTRLVQQLHSFVAVIPAQRTFGVLSNDSIPLKSRAQLDFSKSQSHDKLFKTTDDRYLITEEFDKMIKFLIAEHQEMTNKTHEHYDNKDYQKEKSILENVIDVWEDMITHIKLKYDGQGNIGVSPENGEKYNFIELSDGEKSIFYCIASVLTVTNGGYVIVDEPENHLNMSIVNKLWDTLESKRNDCQFVYLTHNPSFAIGRADSKILWVKKYTHPSHWDYIEIPNNDELPKALTIELVGSRKNILFCEGARDSYDYQLYSTLFKNYTVVPAGGHQEVIDYCKAFNNNQVFNREAIAIIDKDFHEDAEIVALEKNKIYTLNVMEVENILCDKDILKTVQLKVKATSDNYDDAIKQIFLNIQKTKDIQSMEYARFRTDKILNSLVGKSKTPNELKTQLEQEISQLSPQCFYDKHMQLLNEICKEEDYDKALKYYNNKGMLSFVGGKILKEYKDRVINFVKDDDALQQKIIDKYFGSIPK